MEKNTPDLIQCLIAVGSNLPSQATSVRETVDLALELLARQALEISARSRLFRTPAFPAGSGPDFVNAAVIVQTCLSARDLLTCLHDVEFQMGRSRTTRWEARVLDLDLLSYGSAVSPDKATYLQWRNLPAKEQAKHAPEQLILPHPRMQDRGFVLVPLLDVAPNWRHPVLGRTVAEMYAALLPSDIEGISPLDSDGSAAKI